MLNIKFPNMIYMGSIILYLFTGSLLNTLAEPRFANERTEKEVRERVEEAREKVKESSVALKQFREQLEYEDESAYKLHMEIKQLEKQMALKRNAMEVRLSTHTNYVHLKNVQALALDELRKFQNVLNTE